MLYSSSLSDALLELYNRVTAQMSKKMNHCPGGKAWLQAGARVLGGWRFIRTDTLLWNVRQGFTPEKSNFCVNFYALLMRLNSNSSLG